jgi:hypothetical protein
MPLSLFVFMQELCIPSETLVLLRMKLEVLQIGEGSF